MTTSLTNEADVRLDAARSHSLWILLTLSALMAFASISTDIYLPALPTMQQALHAAPGSIELTISGYLIGFSAGQLFWGPLGDRMGRRMPIALGLVLFVIGSTGCALSGSAFSMICWRMVQAAGACSSVVLARAIVRDLYVGDMAARMMSTLLTVMAVAPLIGPTVGGLILHVASWQAIFWLLAVLGLLTLGAVYLLPETLPPAARVKEPLIDAMSGYFDLLRSPKLLGYMGAGAGLYGGIYAYLAGTPFAYIEYYHVAPEHYGLLFAIGVGGIMTANLVNARLVVRLGSDRIMRLGTVNMAAAGLVLAVTSKTGWGGLFGLVVPLFFFVASSGMIVANSISAAMGLFPRHAGSVSALVGAGQYGMGIVGSALVGAFADGTPWPMGAVMAFFGVFGLISTLLVRRRR